MQERDEFARLSEALTTQVETLKAEDVCTVTALRHCFTRMRPKRGADELKAAVFATWLSQAKMVGLADECAGTLKLCSVRGSSGRSTMCSGCNRMRHCGWSCTPVCMERTGGD